ncbi:hypothetical protein Hypma_008936 [Hypsizygus marmoreus]|uniref:Uncharacterized protein n=1 Tax=Hypsizygus marmoreus TaxID=39966 RepID=A0A369JPP7_HYPMA|nr:hypothetical protein Hypma_008936 [Hypsizygus marmoreus]
MLGPLMLQPLDDIQRSNFQIDPDTLFDKLPSNLHTQRILGNSTEADEKIWQDLHDVFLDGGLPLWPHAFFNTLKAPGFTYPISSGFDYALLPIQTSDDAGHVGTPLRRFDYTNPLSRAARTPTGTTLLFVSSSSAAKGTSTQKNLSRIASGENSLLSNNHTLPIFAEFQFEGYHSWNVVDKMLEGLAFIRSKTVAHRVSSPISCFPARPPLALQPVSGSHPLPRWKLNGIPALDLISIQACPFYLVPSLVIEFFPSVVGTVVSHSEGDSDYDATVHMDDVVTLNELIDNESVYMYLVGSLPGMLKPLTGARR